MIKNLPAAWLLARREMGRNRVGWLVSVVSCLYVGAMLYILTGQLLSEVQSKAVIHLSEWVMNLFLLAMVPNTGFLLGKRYLQYYRRDSFTQHLRTLKCLPISDRVLVLSRYLQLLTTAAIMTVLTFIPVYLAFRYDGKLMAITNTEFFALGLTWLAYSIAAGSIYVYLEMGMSGKTYLKISFVFVFLFFLISTAAVPVFSDSFWTLAIHGVQTYGWLVPFAFSLIAAASVLLFARLLERRLAVRDLQ
jgi:hypothetical protein